MNKRMGGWGSGSINELMSDKIEWTIDEWMDASINYCNE